MFEGDVLSDILRQMDVFIFEVLEVLIVGGDIMIGFLLGLQPNGGGQNRQTWFYLPDFFSCDQLNEMFDNKQLYCLETDVVGFQILFSKQYVDLLVELLLDQLFEQYLVHCTLFYCVFAHVIFDKFKEMQ